MALPRKEVRFYLDHDVHARLKRLCECDGLDLTEFVERHVQSLIDREFHRARSLLTTDSDDLGIYRTGPESPVGHPDGRRR